MPEYAEPKEYANGVALTEDMLDAGRDYRLEFFNTTKLDSDNIQDGGIAGTNLAALAITTGKIADLNITTALIEDDAVTTAKITDGAVTNAKLATHPGASGTTGNYTFSTNSVSFTDVKDASNATISASITTTGRPVLVQLAAYPLTSTTKTGYCTTTGGSGEIAILRDSTIVAKFAVSSDVVDLGLSSLSCLDTPSGGSYVYKLQVKVTTASTIAIYALNISAGEV